MNKSTDYSGVDNLEVMQSAVNYNRYLHELVFPRLTRQGLNVDFGAGVGTFSLPFVDLNYPLCCVEADSKLCQHLETQGLKVAQSMEQLTSEKVVNIYSLNVLEHIQDDVMILEQMHQLLAKGGSILIYVPAFQLLYSSMDEKVGHYRRYRIEELEDKVRRVGFVVEKSAYVDSLGFFATLLYKYIGNTDGDINEKSLILYDRLFFPVSILLDRLVHKWFGKNVYVIAKKP